MNEIFRVLLFAGALWALSAIADLIYSRCLELEGGGHNIGCLTKISDAPPTWKGAQYLQ